MTPTGRPKCSDCPRVLAHNPRRKGTRCLGCAARYRQENLSAEQRNAIAERCRRAWKRPGFREAQSHAMARANREAQERDPDLLERRRRWCRSIQPLSVASPSTERNAKISRAKTEQYLGWCPLEYRDDYRKLVRIKRVPARQARKMIAKLIAADLEKYKRTGTLPQSSAASAR